MNTLTDEKRHNKNDDEIDLAALFHQLIEHKKLILFSVSTCLLLGTLYISRQIPIYQSDVLIQVEDSHNNSGSLLGNVSSQLTIGNSRHNSSLIETALIQSRFILEPVSQNLGLNFDIRPKEGFFKKLLRPTQGKVHLSSLSIPKNKLNQPFLLMYHKNNHVTLSDLHNKIMLEGEIGKPLSNAEKNITMMIDKIEAPLNTSFLIIKHPPTLTVRNLANRLKIEDLGRKSGITGILSISINDADPERAAKILNAIALEIKNKDAEKKSLEASKTLEFLNHQLPIVKNDLANAEFALNEYRAKNGKLDIKLQTQAFLERLSETDKQLAALRITEIDMSQRYTSAHPASQALKNQIAAIKNDRDALEKTLRSLPISDQVAVNLMRDVEVKNGLYTSLLNEIQKLQVIKAGMVSDVKILSPATIPDLSLPNKNKLIYFSSILGGLAISFMYIFSKKLLFPRIQDPLWIENQYGIANLAIVPFSPEQHQNTHNPLSSNNKQIPLLAQSNPRNLSIESLRSLRTSLQVHLSCARNNIISILGVMPGVGKTFVSTNLAYLLATAGKRVLLIDADLRRGTTHRYFNVPSSPGLAEFIQGNTSLTDTIKSTSHENLVILPRGNYPDDPSELLSNKNFKETIENLAQQYDIVLIDTAPVLLVTDAVLIGSISSINYLVLGSGIHQPADIEMTVKRLNAANVGINGSIFNFHNASSGKNPYYRKYYSYKQYYVS